jgi:hypothetical protein
MKFFKVKDLTNWILFSSDHNFWEHVFWLGCVIQKMDDHFQRPPMTYFNYPQQIGNYFRK